MSKVSLRATRARNFILRGLAIALLLGGDLLFAQNDARTPKGPALANGVKLPLSFEPCSETSCGQGKGPDSFVSRAPGYTVLVTPTEVLLSLRASQKSAFATGTFADPVSEMAIGAMSRSIRPRGKADAPALRIKLLGANTRAKASALEELPGKSNYFIGRDTRRWRTNVPTYAKARYEDVYPGIDLLYYGTQRQLEFDLVLAPGADPAEIKLAFGGADRLHVDADGDLELRVEGVETRLRKPRVYQHAHDQRQEIGARYVLHDERTVTFELAAYDASEPLIIDPELVYSTYLGGPGGDFGSGIAIDSSGNVYVTGLTASSVFPTYNPVQPDIGGFYDVFVTKLNAAGTGLIYSTYLGGSLDDYGYGIAVDSSGNAYVTGLTASSDFPITSALQATSGGSYDAFVTKLNAAGTALVYSTYLGGSGSEYGSGIGVDSSGNACIAGPTSSADLPIANALQAVNRGGSNDAFVAKLNVAGSGFIYSTYLGGAGDDVAYAIAVDSSGSAYVTGGTFSHDFPTVHPLQPAIRGVRNAFVTKLNAAGSAFVYSTYLGGSLDDYGGGIAVDSFGDVYVSGYTASADFTTVNALQSVIGGGADAFVAMLNATGTGLVYSTYLGGSSNEYANGIVVDPSGDAHVTGATYSADFPVLNAPQSTYGGNGDVFVATLDATGNALVFSTYLGGSGEDSPVVSGITADSSGSVYVTGYTPGGFPTASPLQPAPGGWYDAFVAKIAIHPFLSVSIDIKPGDPNNTINLNSAATVPVAILGSATFDPSTVDPATVTLAGAPVATRRGVPITSVADVNHDGYTDLVLRFRTRDLQLTPTDTEAVLRGQTFSGELIRGADSVRVVPFQRRGRAAREDAPGRRHR